MGTDKLMIYELPGARPILTGPGRPRVLRLTQTRVRLEVARRGLYRLAIRYSPYWSASSGCVLKGRDGMIRLAEARAATVTVRFSVNAERALHALAGSSPDCA
jgi:hypothetical protein